MLFRLSCDRSWSLVRSIFHWLSVQELVNCDKGNDGCKGGNVRDALFYIKHYGLVHESCYPYTGKMKDCLKKCKDKSDWGSSYKCYHYHSENCSGLKNLKTCLAKGSVAAKIKLYTRVARIAGIKNFQHLEYSM